MSQNVHMSLRRSDKVKRLSKKVATLLICGAILSAIYAANETEKAKLRAQNWKLNYRIANLDRTNQDLREALDETTKLLKLYVDNTEVCAAEPPIYNIPLSAALQRYTYYMCDEYGIADYYELALAVMWQESNFTTDLISSTNDYGIMQINYCNYSWLNETLGVDNLLDTYQNINAGTYMLAKLLYKYNDMHRALMAYNMGEAGARSLWAAGIYSSSYSRSVAAKLNELKALKTTG